MPLPAEPEIMRHADGALNLMSARAADEALAEAPRADAVWRTRSAALEAPTLGSIWW